MKTLCKFFILFLISFNLYAHNVVGGVYATGDEIEGEAGFSTGAMAKAGTIVKVTDTSGTPLGETTTDGNGYFTFMAKKRITYLFEVNMGAGHILKMQLPAEELPDSLGVLPGQSASSVLTTQSTVVAGGTMTLDMFEKAMAKQIRPLRREINQLKAKSGLRDILGGIGYIFGLLGLIAFIRERKSNSKNKNEQKGKK